MAENDIKTLKETAKSAKQAAEAITAATSALSEQMAVVAALNTVYEKFANMQQMSDMAKTLQELSPELEKLIDNSKDTTKEFQEMLDEMEDVDDTLESLTEKMKDLSKTTVDSNTLSTQSFTELAKSTQKTSTIFKSLGTITRGTLGAAMGGLIGIVQGITSAFTGFFATGKGVVGLFTNLIGWSFQLGAAILSIPVRFLGGLVEMASQMNLGMSEYLRKIEEVRDKFGNFRVGQSQAIKEMQKGFAQTTETGLNAWRIYGNLAERLQAITELVEGLGATWGKFSGEMASDGYVQAKRIDEFRMGLGLSQEQLKSTLMLTSAMGKTAGKSLTDLTKHVKGYAKALNISHKVITRDVADAIKDAGKFGGATVDAIARASAYARGLGHELKEIAGVLDAFETFDTAAEGAAKMAQSFGATVDAFKLVASQSPDEMIQTLRDSMFAAGKSADQMNRQELKLLASQSGLSEEVARSVFSMKNQGKSVEDLMKLQEKQEDAQVTQAQALKSLAEDIRRLVKEMQPLQRSYVSMFIDGMKKGATRSKEFIGLMMEIRQGLMLTWREGFKLGQVLLKEVPALQKLMEGLRGFFAPEKFQKLAQKMRFILLDFFKGTNGVSDLLHRSKEAFMDFFDASSTSTRQMLDGAKMIMKRISQVFAEGISWVGKQMTEGIKFITDIISGKKKLGEVGSMGKGGLGFLGEILMPIFKAIAETAPDLGRALLDLIVVAGGKLIDALASNKSVQSAMHKAGLVLIGILAVSIASRAAIGTIVGALTSTILGGVGGLIKGGLSKKISDAAGKVADKSPKFTKGAEQAGSQTGTMVEGWVKAAIATKQVTLKDIGKLFLIIAALGAGLAAAGVLFALGIKQMYNELKGIKLEELLPVFASLGMLITSTVVVAGAMSLIGKVADMKAMALGAAAMAVVALGIVGLTWLVGKVAKSFQESNISPSMLKATGDLMFTMSKTMLLMIPILVASALMGATMMGPQGVLVAAAAGLGFAAISAGMAGLTGITFSIIKTLNKIPKSSNLAENSQIFTNILNSVGSMIGTIAAMLKEFSPGFTDFLNIFTGGKITDRIEAATQYIGELMPSIQKLVNSVKSAVESIGSKGADSLKGAEVFASIFASMSQFMKILSPTKEMMEGDTQKIAKMLYAVSNNFNAMFETMTSEKFKQFLLSASSMIQTSEQIKSIEAVGGIITSVGNIIKSIADALKAPELKNISGEKINVQLNFHSADINKVLSDLAGEQGGIKQIFDTIMSMTSNIGNTKDLTARINLLSTVFNGVGQVTSFLKTLSENSKSNEDISYVKSIKTSIVENGLLPALEAVQQMADSVSKMNSALANISLGKASVQTGLRNVANAMGVGGKASYNIQNKPINIHLEIQVEMKAAEVEKIIVFRKESIIRDQLRWIRGSEPGRDAFQDNTLSSDVNTRYIQHVTG